MGCGLLVAHDNFRHAVWLPHQHQCELLAGYSSAPACPEGGAGGVPRVRPPAPLGCLRGRATRGYVPAATQFMV